MRYLFSLGLAIMLAVGAATAADTLVELERELADARRLYDVNAATRVLAEARVVASGSEEREAVVALRIRAGLLLAELLRIQFEQTAETARAERRELGQRIDAAAEEALGLLDRLSDSSERFRLEADLVATMIRSDFRAKKYRARLESATQRALELDPRNARAWVTSAKPFVFADPEHGGDLDAAIERLDRALELEPGLESALLLRALVLERHGDRSAAIADWRSAVRANPDCAPARRALEAS